MVFVNCSDFENHEISMVVRNFLAGLNKFFVLKKKFLGSMQNYVLVSNRLFHFHLESFGEMEIQFD